MRKSALSPDTAKFKNYSHASKLRQAAIDPKLRKKRALKAAAARWKGTTKEQRRDHAMVMVKGRAYGR